MAANANISTAASICFPFFMMMLLLNFLAKKISLP